MNEPMPPAAELDHATALDSAQFRTHSEVGQMMEHMRLLILDLERRVSELEQPFPARRHPAPRKAPR